MKEYNNSDDRMSSNTCACLLSAATGLTCRKHALISLSQQPGEGGLSYDPVLLLFS